MSTQLQLPLVSIVITSYNYARFIPDALESVSRQTYRPLECIVVDDCSTDNSPEVIRQTVGKLETLNNGIRYSVISTGKNSGQLAAFQLGIKKAAGVFINFLDADDFLFPDFLSTHIQAHLENIVTFTFNEPVEIDDRNQVHCRYSNTGDIYSLLNIPRHPVAPVPFDELKKRVTDRVDANEVFNLEKNTVNRSCVQWNVWHWYPTSTAVFRRNALLPLAEIPDAERWRICADTLLFCFANVMGNSCFVPASVSAYRRHGKNGFAGDVMIGEYRYLPEKSTSMASSMYNKNLPLSLLQLFSLMREKLPNKSVEFAQTLIYQMGPVFLLQNWKAVFSSFPVGNGLQRMKLLVKTVIRHARYKRKNHA